MAEMREASRRPAGLVWLLVVVLVAGGIAANHIYSEQPLLYRVLALLGLSLVALGLVALTPQGQALWHLLKEARTEIRKVVWPTHQETVRTTFLVVVVVIVMALILWGLDSLLSWGVSSVIG